MKLYLTLAIDNYEPVIYGMKAFLEHKAAIEYANTLRKDSEDYSVRVEEVDCPALDALLKLISKKLDERTVYQSLEVSTWPEFEKQIEWLRLYNDQCDEA